MLHFIIRRLMIYLYYTAYTYTYPIISSRRYVYRLRQSVPVPMFCAVLCALCFVCVESRGTSTRRPRHVASTRTYVIEAVCSVAVGRRRQTAAEGQHSKSKTVERERVDELCSVEVRQGESSVRHSGRRHRRPSAAGQHYQMCTHARPTS